MNMTINPEDPTAADDEHDYLERMLQDLNPDSEATDHLYSIIMNALVARLPNQATASDKAREVFNLPRSFQERWIHEEAKNLKGSDAEERFYICHTLPPTSDHEAISFISPTGLSSPLPLFAGIGSNYVESIESAESLINILSTLGDCIEKMEG